MVLGVNIDFASRLVQVGAPSTQWWTQLSSAIVFGLSFATILTLLFTPCALMLRENLRVRFARDDQDQQDSPDGPRSPLPRFPGLSGGRKGGSDEVPAIAE